MYVTPNLEYDYRQGAGEVSAGEIHGMLSN